MHSYIICYNLDNPGGEHPEQGPGELMNFIGKVDNAIRGLGKDALYIGPAMVTGKRERRIWAVKTDHNKSVVKDRVEKEICKQGKCVVIEIGEEEHKELAALLES